MQFAASRYIVSALPVFALLGALPICAQPIAPEVAETLTLLQNGGFEAGGALPDWWARFPAEPQSWGRHLRDTQIAYRGAAGGLLISDEPHPPGAGVQWNRYGIPVRGGETLIVSYWIRVQDTGPIGAGCHFYDAQRTHLGFVPARPSGDCREWTYVREYVDVPAEARSMGFPLYGGDSGKTWFDEVSLLTVPEHEAVVGTPTLDGRLEEACWAAGKPLAPFAIHTGEGLAVPQPEARMAYDENAIHFAFSCPHRPGVALLANATEHDQDVWLDDSVEVFIAPGADSGDYYTQVCVNSLGVIRDSRGMDPTWESGATAAALKEAGRWTVELSVPYEHLGIDLRVGNEWGINLVANNRTIGQTSTWSLGGFHRPGRFGRVRMAPDLSRYTLPDLAASLARSEGAIAGLEAEVSAVALGAGPAAGVAERLDRARGLIAALRQVSAAADPGPDGWAGVAQRVDEVGREIAAARGAAVEGLFAIGGGEGGCRVAVAHALQKVRRDGPVTDGLLAREVKLQAAGDEAESFQLVVMPAGEKLTGVTVQAGPLTGPGGEIPVVWHRVDYLETAEPKYKTEYVGWWPDPLLPAAPFDVEADRRQPVWCTVNVPPQMPAGTYRGEVEVRHAGRGIAVPVELTVRDFTLPRPGTLATAFGLYAGALKYWWWPDDEYLDHMPIEMYRDWCEFLGRYRLAPKNIARDYIATRREGDGIAVDLSALDQTVKPLAARYFAPYSFCLHRLPSAVGMEKTTTGTSALAAVRETKAFADEWERAGLPEEVFIYGYDEPKTGDYAFLREAYTAIGQAVPDYPIMQTLGDANPEPLAGLVDIWCPLTPALTSGFYRTRLQAGDTLWTYVCCAPRPPYANFFVDEPATDHRILFWQLRRAGGTGFLYWCLCRWTGLPNEASGEPCFPDVPIHFSELGTYKQFGVNGDGVLIYPGKHRTPLPSIRLEVIRDGIEDYEYLAMLSSLVQRARALPESLRPGDEVLSQAEALCTVPEEMSQSMTVYTKDPQVIMERRREIGDMIETLGQAAGSG